MLQSGGFPVPLNKPSSVVAIMNSYARELEN